MAETGHDVAIAGAGPAGATLALALAKAGLKVALIDAGAPAADARIVQGALEGSNVRAVVELTRMIEISRAYEAAAKMISNDDTLRKSAIETLGKT